LRKIEIEHDKLSCSSGGGIYHLSTSNSHTAIQVHSGSCIGDRATGHNRDAAIDAGRRLRLNGRTGQYQHRYANDQERYEGRAE
jgi:hypothetical protein